MARVTYVANIVYSYYVLALLGIVDAVAGSEDFNSNTSHGGRCVRSSQPGPLAVKAGASVHQPLLGH